MKFYTLKEIPVQRDDKVFKASPIAPAIALVLFFGVGVLFFFYGMRSSLWGYHFDFPRDLAYCLSAGCGLIAYFCFCSARARSKPTNWILRCNQSGVLIKYRSYQNWRMPADDVQVVGLDYSEIAWTRAAKVKRTSPSLGGDNEKETQLLSFLDFGLVNRDTTQLEAKLTEERARPWWFRALTFPVEVLPDGIVRLQWRNFGGGAYSNPDDALKWLRQFVTIQEAVAAKTDLSYQANLSEAEQEARIRQLAKSGDKMGAIKLTRQVYGCSLAEAVQFVEKL